MRSFEQWRNGYKLVKPFRAATFALLKLLKNALQSTLPTMAQHNRDADDGVPPADRCFVS